MLTGMMVLGGFFSISAIVLMAIAPEMMRKSEPAFAKMGIETRM